MAPSPNSLRSLRSLRSDSRDESAIDARCARGHEPCASRRSKGALQPARARLCEAAVAFCRRANTGGSRRAVPGGGDFCCDEKHRPGVGARSALRQPSRRRCLSAANEVSVASSATRPRADAVSPDTEQSKWTVLCLAHAQALASAWAAVQSVRSADRHGRSPHRVPPAATRASSETPPSQRSTSARPTTASPRSGTCPCTRTCRTAPAACAAPGARRPTRQSARAASAPVRS